jgi:hypothetical protein
MAQIGLIGVPWLMIGEDPSSAPNGEVFALVVIDSRLRCSSGKWEHLGHARLQHACCVVQTPLGPRITATGSPESRSRSARSYVSNRRLRWCSR